MKRYSPERKETILRKMAPPLSLSVAEGARQEGIPTATVYNWRHKTRARGAVLPSRSAPPDRWTSEEKFRLVLETAPMNAAELSAYCRERGLYPEQIEAWKHACMRANVESAEQEKLSRQTRKAEQQRKRQLETEPH